jgi:hypothetical protein
LTAEQLEAARAERMRLNGYGTLTLEDARTWIEETGLCLFLPRRQFSASIAPSFVEAVAGRQDATPDHEHIALAEELLVRLETDGVAVRLNLLGQPGEQLDYVVASWVLPYVYALRGDRDWRRSPQLTGSRQVSQLAVQAYKLLETADTTIADLTHTLGREVTEGAVLRAITELWQQLRIIPVISAPGQPAKWQLLRQRFQKAIAEGASTSQVTAISVLASIYLQAVIAATMEEVEIFLSSLTARSKVREVLRGLMATRQVHTIPMGHSPHFYVAGTLPEFSVAPTLYASVSVPASAYFMRSFDEEVAESQESPESLKKETPQPTSPTEEAVSIQPAKTPEPSTQRPSAPRAPAVRKPLAGGRSSAARPHFSRPPAHTRDRKPAQSSSSNRAVRRAATESRSVPAGPIPTGRIHPARPTNGAKPANGEHGGPSANAKRNGKAGHPANGSSAARTSKSTSPSWSQRNGGASGAKPAAKPSASPRNGSNPSRNGGSSRTPELTAGAQAGNGKRYNFVARPKQEQKKRG